MEPERIAIKLTEHEKELESHKRRIKNCEDELKEYKGLAASVESLATSMKSMLEEQKKQGERLERLEQAPAEDFKYYRRTVAGCIITGIVGAVVGALIMLIIK